MFAQPQKIYDRLVLGKPVVVLVLLLAVLAYFGFHARDFKLDASADSLLLEGDQDLRAFRDVASKYQIRAFLFVTFTPSGDLFPHIPLR